ncbi:MAG: hypothetical protein DYG89_48000 [Caldilinea sp. CFX5]|nr:hypothetical protein [Caldilinea sp. CFX5]
MPDRLQLTLFGSPEVRRHGQPVTGFRTSKAQALLYYLAVTGRPHTRATLAGLLWGDQPEDAARASLSKCLSNLRDLLSDAVLIERQTVAFNRDAAYELDTERFADGVGQPPTVASSQALQAALALYRGDLLEGFYVREAPDFEQWLLVQRAHYREAVINGLHALAGFHEQQGDLPGAITHTRRLLALEPWREEAHRQLMTLLARSGQRAAALAQFEICRRVLAEELAVEPAAETTQLYANLRHNFLPASDRQETVAMATTVALPLSTTAPAERVQPQPLVAPEYPLVGRHIACQRLLEMWPTAMQTGVQLVCITGEAGIGKTRLAEELLMAVQRQGHATVRTRAYALEGRLAYAPLADWLRSPPLQGNLAKLNPLWRSEVARLLPELLIQEPTLAAPQPLTERWQQKQFFEALRHAFTADPRPLLLLLDDLQWCDPDTLAWLQYLFDTAPQTPLLVVGTVRSDEVDDDHPLHKLRRMLLHGGKLTTIELAPLSAEETAALGAQVAKYALDSRAATQLYLATAGNPLFVIESVRAGDRVGTDSKYTEEGLPWDPSCRTCSTPQSILPPKVYAVIEARLAQLSPTARTLAQVAATIGRTFTVPLLVAASHQDEEQVVQGLDELWQRRLVREQGNARYDFSHDRIRDVTYAESSPVKRALFHQRVALALEKLHADKLDAVAGELAGHYQCAGMLEQAFTYFQQAAKVAQQLYAHSQEADYLQKALAIVQLLPPNSVSSAHQSDLWSELGLAQVLIHGWSHELVATAWQKADEWAVQAGNPVQRCGTLGSLRIVARNRGEWRKACELDELALAVAKASGNLALINQMSVDFGTTLTYVGELLRALAHYRASAMLRGSPAQYTSTGEDNLIPGTIIHMAQCLWLLGFPDQALAWGRQALAIREQEIPFVNRFPRLAFAGKLYSCVRDAPTVQHLAQELIAISTRYDFPFFVSIGELLLGWAIAQQGDVETGLSLLQKNLGQQRKWSSHMFETYYRSLLAETLALAGEREEALEQVTAALAYAEERGSCYWNAHLLKLKGDFLLALAASTDEVEEWYQQAIVTARRQGAKSLELRATTSLCRLWQGLGKQEAARSLLAEIYGWFTEGFDTVDLKEAKALLDTL